MYYYALLSRTLCSGFKYATSRIEKLPNIEQGNIKRTYLRLSDGQIEKQREKWKQVIERVFSSSNRKYKHAGVDGTTKQFIGWDIRTAEILGDLLCQRNTKLNNLSRDLNKFNISDGNKNRDVRYFKANDVVQQAKNSYIKKYTPVVNYTPTEDNMGKVIDISFPKPSISADCENESEFLYENYLNRPILPFIVSRSKVSDYDMFEKENFPKAPLPQKASTDKETLSDLKIPIDPEFKPRPAVASQEEQMPLKKMLENVRERNRINRHRELKLSEKIESEKNQRKQAGSGRNVGESAIVLPEKTPTSPTPP